jgi:osmotically-inducible protein OsmY
MNKLAIVTLLVSGASFAVACAHEGTTAPPETAVIVTRPSPEADENSWGAANVMPESTVQTPLQTNDRAEEDLRITAGIRTAIKGDKTLSFAARKIEIVTRDGAVVLRGSVKSGHERGSIEKTARTMSGVTGVDNLLEVRE